MSLVQRTVSPFQALNKRWDLIKAPATAFVIGLATGFLAGSAHEPDRNSSDVAAILAGFLVPLATAKYTRYSLPVSYQNTLIEYLNRDGKNLYDKSYAQVSHSNFLASLSGLVTGHLIADIQRPGSMEARPMERLTAVLGISLIAGSLHQLGSALQTSTRLKEAINRSPNKRLILLTDS